MSPLKIAIHLDPLEDLKIQKDSTLAIAREAVERKHHVWIYHPRGLTASTGRIIRATARRLRLVDQAGTGRIEADAASQIELAQFDVVLFRQDPPIDLSYLASCHLLSLLPDYVLIVNSPRAILSSAEKLLPLKYPDLHPPTIVSGDREVLHNFREKHGDVVLKPIYDFCGSGVFRIRPDDENFDSAIATLQRLYGAPVILQQYLPSVRNGDKRIFLLDGKPIGAVNRVPACGDARSNLFVGGTPEATTLSTRDYEICAAIGPDLAEAGLYFVGIDVIGSSLIEINFTAPTGILQIRDVTGVDLSPVLLDWIEHRRL